MQFDEFLSIVDLLKDTTKYEAKVAELEARNKAIQDSITQLNVASDIVKAKKQIDTLNARAQTAVESANIQAGDILAAAEGAYKKKFAELQEKEVVADQALANYKTQQEQWAARESAIRAGENEVNKAMASIQVERAAIAVKQAEVDERLAKLRQVMG